MTSYSDIPTGGWIEKVLPKVARPYATLMRLDRPIGTWLLLLPCWWSLALGWQLNQNEITLWELAHLYLVFSVGAIVMRGAGCTVNDLWDKKLDQLVERTANRPIASGMISVPRAIMFLLFQLSIGLLVLLQLNETCWLLGISILFLVFSYPAFKRFTYWPQFILGLTFNWGALMGWVAITGKVDFICLALYVAGIFWTLGYDTIYAHQDKTDDEIIGVKSSALALGDKTKPFIYIVYSLTIIGILLIGWINLFEIPFFVFCLIALSQLIWQIYTVNINEPSDCLKKFKSNRLFGLLITIAIFLG
ncbi:MAG: 4-hydroxybenzoate octaprenyltransferase [Rhodospirillaceae bacterium]|jgi:4-hydroxybenzoate polyprenyltransferase|nr:4-hydroxybenzoate octaprenyltransferase [Rhodospirillaceae bacterium]MDC0998653.1 4-hydroxybenzoate octaprenyltransferase [Alphaproteobacteria bacterium]